MAGHVLSLNHKPSAQLDLDHELGIAMDYILAKQHGVCWNKICRNSLAKFRRFLLHERGRVESKIKPYDAALHTEGLPAWLVEQLIRYQHIKQRNWREARIEEGIRRFWSSHLRVWRFLVERFAVSELSDVKRAYFSDFIDWRLSAGASVRSVNGDLRTFHGFMDTLQEQGLPVPHALLRLRCLKEPDPLPKFLTDTQVRALRDDFEQQVAAAYIPAYRRDALLDRAWFYLLWQAGMRRGEVEDLRLEDLDLEGRRLTVRRGQGLARPHRVPHRHRGRRAPDLPGSARTGADRPRFSLPQPGALQTSDPWQAQGVRGAGQRAGVRPSSQAHLRHPTAQRGLPDHQHPEVPGA